MIKWNWWI